MRPNLKSVADLVRFTQEILSGKLHFLLCVTQHTGRQRLAHINFIVLSIVAGNHPANVSPFSNIFSPFVPNALFLYPLKTSENLKFSCFQGVEKGCIGNKSVK